MNKYISSVLSLAAVGCLCGSISTQASIVTGHTITEYEYDFTPTDSSSGFGGALVLKEASNANGSAADVDTSRSYLDTPDGNYNLDITFDPPFDPYISFGSSISQNGVFAWDGSTITDMDLSGEIDTYFYIFFQVGGINWEITPTSISETPFTTPVVVLSLDPSASGTWNFAQTLTIPVPDGVNTAVLFGSAALALGACQLRQRRAQRA
ncbi:MAG TPA: hypothetical protein VHB20_14880 [Verrucomicrobiae bacterium]|jgi:hypothetical protein|nr:hypothetical protein [Verrucomicrobiae bacterium]